MRMIVVTGLLALAFVAGGPAFACPPPPLQPPGTPLPTREELLQRMADSYAVIAYAVAEDEIDLSPGRVRILHVYKGSLRVGQRLLMAVAPTWTSCTPPPEELFARRGDYGILLLRPDADESGPPLPFPGFAETRLIEQMIAAGILRSARVEPQAVQ